MRGHLRPQQHRGHQQQSLAPEGDGPVFRGAQDFYGPVPPADPGVQPVQRRAPSGPAQLASPVHHIAFTQGTKLQPVGGEQFVPGGLQGAGGSLHDIVAAQDIQDPFVIGGPQFQAPGDLAPRVRQRRRADRCQVILDARQPPVSMLRQSWTVNRQLITDPAVRILLLTTWLPPAFIAAAESLIVPYAAQHGFPAGSPGLILACIPAGMIAGDFAAGRLLRPATRERLTIPLIMVAGLPLLAFTAGPPLPAAAGLLAVTGIGPAYLLGIQRRFLDAVPAPVLGQAFGLLSTGLMTSQGVGPALFGAIAQIISAGDAMALAGAATIVTALGLLPALRK